MSNVNTMNKTELRAACKKAKVTGYGDMTVTQMRAALINEADLNAFCSPAPSAPEAVVTTPAEPDVPPEAIANINTAIGELAREAAAKAAAPDPMSEPSRVAAKAAPAPTVKDSRNGVTKPRDGSTCRAIWNVCDAIAAAGEHPSFGAIKTKLPKVNDATIRTQRQRWRTYHAA